MKVQKIQRNKKQYLDLLLLADEQESMIDRYLNKGDLFAFYEGTQLIGVCVVTQEKNKSVEIKNIAVVPFAQGKGYGKRILSFIEDTYRKTASCILVGTGDSPLTVPFYEHCGFSYSHSIKDFFLKFYDHPIYEEGKQLVDMIYLKKELV